LLELDQGTQGRLANAGDATCGRGPQGDPDRDRLVIVEQKRRDVRTDTKGITAGDALDRRHRIVKSAEFVNVPPNGSSGHAEAVGDFAA